MSVTTEIYSFSKKRADSEIIKSLDKIKTGIKSGELKRSDLNDIKYECMEDYLNFGKYESILVNSPMGDNQRILEIGYFIEYFELETVDEYIPTKDALIKLYSLINTKNLQEIIDSYAKEEDLSLEDAQYNIVEHTLRKMIPLVKSFKENSDSILVISNDYDFPNVIPEYISKSFQEQFGKI